MEEMKKLVGDLAILNVGLIKEVEEKTRLRVHTYRDVDRIIMNGKMTITYGESIKILEENIRKYKGSNSLFKRAITLKEKILDSPIKDLRFGLEPQKRFTKTEHELDRLFTVKQLEELGKMKKGEMVKC